MPVEAKLIKGKVRTVEEGTRKLARAKGGEGRPRDGGGWPDTQSGWARAKRQEKYINDALRRKA